mmetsp:Transcript_33772/g.95567  ORF Transcript_33772/g.95567 Transcript_33772/m.95567 type:complete len:313 (-) Transcript_33772:864-1802(-)
MGWEVMDVFRSAASDEDPNALQQAAAGCHDIIVVRAAQENYAGKVLSTGHHTDTFHLLNLPVALPEHCGHNPLAALVVCNCPLHFHVVREPRAAHPLQDTVDGVVHVLRVDDVSFAPNGLESRLVENVGELCAAQTGQIAGDLLKVDIFAYGVLSCVDLKYIRPALCVWLADFHLAVKTSSAHEGRVQQISPVGGRNKHHANVRGEAVHLREKLVQSLLTLLVGSHAGLCTPDAQGVDLVHKDDARCVDTRTLEKVAHAGGSHTHNNLHKLAATHLVEWHLALACDGLCHQCFAGARTTLQQHTFWRLCIKL